MQRKLYETMSGRDKKTMRMESYYNGSPLLLKTMTSPTGIMPCKLHRQKRMEIIIDAMLRYTKANMQIPKEWLEELTTINERIYTKNV